jgi:hypothetical protein
MIFVLLFRKANFNSIRVSGLVILFFIGAFFGYGQSENRRLDILRVHSSEIEHWLLPAPDDADEKHLVAAFLVNPYLSPNYSVCLIDSARHFFLELRQLDKNIWIELFTRFTKKERLILPITVSLCLIKVSRGFKKKMLASFAKMIPFKGPYVPVN